MKDKNGSVEVSRMKPTNLVNQLWKDHITNIVP